MIKVTSVITFICYLFQFVVSQTELRFAFTFWRHGARAPDRGVKVVNNENVDFLGEAWNMGGGELLPVGMRMHYLLGRFNRKRWVEDESFLSSSFIANELYVKSTEYNRTMMSVLSHLQGLYPSGSGPTLNPVQAEKAYPPIDPVELSSVFDDDDLVRTTNLGVVTSYNALPNGIQVIPVHLLKPDGDYFFFYNAAVCPKYAETLKNNAVSKTNLDIAAEINTAWGQKLRTALGIDDEKYFLTFSNMYLVCDTFVSGHTDGRTFAKLRANNVFSEQDLEDFLEEAEKFEFNNIFDYYNGDDGEDKLVPRMVMTPFFNDLLRWMETRISYDKDSKGYTGYAAPKLVIYSAHDMNIGAAQKTLYKAFVNDPAKERITTKFASSFIFELRRPTNKLVSAITEADYTVDIFYNHELYHTGAYTTFKNKLRNEIILTPEQLDLYCGWNKSNTGIIDPLLVKDPVPTSYIDATIVLSCLLFVAVIAIIVLIILLARKPKSYAVSHTDKVMPTV
jgi:hypothetical protein